MKIIVVYDIADSKRLYKVAKTCEQYGVRVQESVFECDISRDRIVSLKSALDGIVNKVQDSIRIYYTKQSNDFPIIIGKSARVEGVVEKTIIL